VKVSTPPAASAIAPELAELVEAVTSRLKTGDVIDLDALLREHPAHADELRRLLPAMKLLASLPGSGAEAAADAGFSTVEPLGDYRLVREVGRGGMGIVYEAEQLSLGRRVALKVLPYAATLDPKQLQRFKNEAKAAASLRHEHIVAIYGVGCQRGVHYYAMEFVEGQTLAQLIAWRAGLRQRPVDSQALEYSEVHALTQPRSPIMYRAVVRLIADAADALEHAHSMGVVHRDVKPGNLLLDASRKVYVSDFGLARFGPDAGMTMTGDLLGTLRYMSPEQALAKHGLVDHRTDIYGLGCTLYELLTGRPAVGGEDKAEILHQIADEEPTPPRKFDRSIPAELETITLKALSKNPEDRYATAGELADDLRRWLDDRTIKARPPTLRQKTAKWARRHAAGVWGTAAVALAASAGLAASTAILVVKEGEAREATKQAWSEQAHAEANAKLALEALDRVYLKLVGKRSPEEQFLGEEQKKRLNTEEEKLLADVLEFYQRLAGENAHDPLGRLHLAYANLRVAEIRQKLGLDGWRPYQDEGFVRYRELVRQFPEDTKYRYGLANNLAASGRFPEAAAVYERAAAAEPGNPGPELLLSLCYRFWVRSLESEGRADEADQVWHKLIEHTQKQERLRPGVGQGLFQLALAYQLRAEGLRERRDSHRNSLPGPKLVEAEIGLLRDAHDILATKLPPKWEKDPLRLTCLALVCRDLGDVFLASNRPADAEPYLQQALELHRPFFAGKSDLARDHLNLARAWKDLGRAGQSEQAVREAVGILDPLAKSAPQEPDREKELGAALDYLASLIYDRGDAAEARRLWKRSVTCRQRALALMPDDLDLRDDLAWLLATCPEPAVRDPAEAIELAQKAVARKPDSSRFWNTLGAADCAAGNWTEAITALEKSAERNHGGGAFDWFLLAMAHAHLGHATDARAYFDRAVAWTEEHKPRDTELRRFRKEAADLLSRPDERRQ
jgi:serine/threonine protein kinase/tetratricopeptide (TPR) repeat protein